jgi:hypothetical protein
MEEVERLGEHSLRQRKIYQYADPIDEIHWNGFRPGMR